MHTKITEADATFVDLCTVTGYNTACDGDDRSAGGLFEQSPSSGMFEAYDRPFVSGNMRTV